MVAICVLIILEYKNYKDFVAYRVQFTKFYEKSATFFKSFLGDVGHMDILVA
jgi:hypothetical protein